MPERRAGWILTGGKSSRMGSDKAFLPHLTGQPLAAFIASELAKVCESVSFIGDPGRYSSLGVPVIADRFSDAGPLAGIEAALGATSAPWNLIVACDMPSIDAGFLNSLFETGDADCVLPQHEDGRTEPLCAVYHRRCHPVILAALERGIRKVTDALQPLELRYVRVASALPFANLNTQEDFRKYSNG